MTVDPSTAKWSHSYGSRTYYFCGKGCMTKFAADPRKYLEAQVAPRVAHSAQPAPPPHPRPPPASVIYTCPMHPEVRRPSPGACPICGMALEPVEAVPAASTTEYV